MRRRIAAAATAVLLGATGCASAPADEPPAGSIPEHIYAKPPIGLKIEEVAGGLDQAWEFGFLPDG